MRVEWLNDHLVYERKSMGETPVTDTIFPTDQQWREFWEAAEACDVWSWKPARDVVVLDGDSWDIELSDGRRFLKMEDFRGVLEPYQGGQGYSDSFKRFLEALQKLVGGRPV